MLEDNMFGAGALTGTASDPRSPGFAIAVATTAASYTDVWEEFNGGAPDPPLPPVDLVSEAVIAVVKDSPCTKWDLGAVTVEGDRVDVGLVVAGTHPCVTPPSLRTQLVVLAVPKEQVPEGPVTVRLVADGEHVGAIRGVLREAGWQPPATRSLPWGAIGGGLVLIVALAVAAAVAVRRS